MAKVTLILCDVKPCTYQAQREFEVNGEALYVCGEQCFTTFWSREYGNWNGSRYKMQITFQHPALKLRDETEESSEKKIDIELARSDLRIVKRPQG